MMRAGERTSEAGFTIVELIVALCILALIATYALASFRNVHQMNELMERIEGRAAIEAVQNHLYDLLSRARPIAVMIAGQPTPVVAFMGERSRLQLAAASEGTLETGGMYAIAVETRIRSDGLLDLVTTRRLLRSTKRQSEDLTLVEGISGLRFRYFGQGSPEERAKWHDRWTQEEVLPRLVEITVSFPSGVKQSWPRLIARPASGS
jgi:prepilin-type N-terminal cleavage/methylation domain-containing protein